MTPQSAKAKGRRLQKDVVELLLEAFPDLEEDDIDWTSMGASGEDILLSPKAQRLIPFSMECKNQEKLNIWSSLEQAKSNETEDRPGTVVFKRNFSDVYIALTFADFVALLQVASEAEIAKDIPNITLKKLFELLTTSALRDG